MGEDGSGMTLGVSGVPVALDGAVCAKAGEVKKWNARAEKSATLHTRFPVCKTSSQRRLGSHHSRLS